MDKSFFAHLNTKKYCQYVDSIFLLAERFVPLFSGGRSHQNLTASIVFAYILSSQFRAPPSQFRRKLQNKQIFYPCKEVAEFVHQYKDHTQPLLFLPGLFTAFESGLFMTHTLSIPYIEKLFPDFTMYRSNGEMYPVDYAASAFQVLSRNYIYHCLDRFSYNKRLYNGNSDLGEDYAQKALKIFTTFGFSNRAVIEYAHIFFEEYFWHVSSTMFKDISRRPTLKFLSHDQEEHHSQLNLFVKTPDIISLRQIRSMEFRFKFLLPIPETDVDIDDIYIKKLIEQKNVKHWGNFGSRAILLQYYLCESIPVRETLLFHQKVLLFIQFFALRLPTTSSSKIYITKGKGMEFKEWFPIVDPALLYNVSEDGVKKYITSYVTDRN